MAVEIVGFFGAIKGHHGLPKANKVKARTWLGRRGRVVLSRAAGGPFGLFDIVLPLFDNILRSLGHTLIRMRPQLSDGQTSFAFLWIDVVRSVALGRRRWIAHPKNGFIYARLLLQGSQNFHHGLDKKNTIG